MLKSFIITLFSVTALGTDDFKNKDSKGTISNLTVMITLMAKSVRHEVG
jgi:hypothetical protein